MTGRTVSILGSTGSVGRNTVDLLEKAEDDYRVEALAAGRNAELLAHQALTLGARYAAVRDPAAWNGLKSELSGSGVEIAAGPEAVEEAGRRSADWVMAAIGGAEGLLPVLRAVERGATVAIANKETLVCAGDFLMTRAKEHGATFLPVDSEHNAIFQASEGARPDWIESITLTASGGPFLDVPLEHLNEVTPEDAVAHPVWDMGAKISVDSATMMNKALEVIEACRLFALSPEQVRVLIHRQSIVHGMVEYVDGTNLAVLGVPDMRTPIASALAWPRRMPVALPALDLAALGTLTFETPDLARFPALRMAYDALRAGRSAPTILNAANEVAVAAFLGGKLPFSGIAAVVETVLDRLPIRAVDSLDTVLEVDDEARRETGRQVCLMTGQPDVNGDRLS